MVAVLSHQDLRIVAQELRTQMVRECFWEFSVELRLDMPADYLQEGTDAAGTWSTMWRP